jgi:spore coat polysaccharide biosynthesis predicted glycosyltransferase SpsG
VFGICLESSHARGMGHFYRMLNLAEALKLSSIQFKFFINNHTPSLKIFDARNYEYEIVDLLDYKSGWEHTAIHRDAITLWINDRLDTDIEHAKNIKHNKIPLVTFDDHGSGAGLADIHIAALSFDSRENLGKKILQGPKYLILNHEIEKYRRLRKKVNSIVVTLGGSDTYGVTAKIVKILATQGKTATVIIGPGYEHMAELKNTLSVGFVLKQEVPSLIEEFYNHDLAITGGGITPFEANASGLPCIVIANELFEIPVGEKLQEMGGSVFLAYHGELQSKIYFDLPIEKMSRNGMLAVSLTGCDLIVEELLEVLK